jgi:symplekin
MERIGGLVTRIWEEADELKPPTDLASAQGTGQTPVEIWMLLLVRMITRVAYPTPLEDDASNDSDDKELVINDFYERQDQKRQTLCNYIMSDFPARCVI